MAAGLAWMKRLVPDRIRRYVENRLHGPDTARSPRPRWGSLRRLSPISTKFGLDRGLPIDRYYVERFLSTHAEDIRGHVLEVMDPTYTRKFGRERVTRCDVVSLTPGRNVTLVEDLAHASSIPSDTFDCIILTQTLQMIYEIHSAVRHLHRILRPGGVLLMTSHGISKLYAHDDRDPHGEYWHLTPQSARRLFCELFPSSNVRVDAFGNVLAAIAFLHGLSAEELRTDELDRFDPDYPVLVAVRAVRP